MRIISLTLAALMLTALSLSAVGDEAVAVEYSNKGADSCLRCHRKEEWRVTGIFATKHGSMVDPAAPLSNEQCESCHGPSNAHARARDEEISDFPPYISFGPDSTNSVPQQNQACMNCHNDHEQGWFGNAHERTDVSCVSCHDIHGERDAIRDPVAQQEVCYSCHPRTRADSHRSSVHPLRFGEMSCSSCHNVHEGDNDFLLTSESVNETCYECHAEKRGPFLYEHAPVTEDCSSCHRPHGSNQPALLTKRPPLLCQQCHSASDHPGVAYTGDDLGIVPTNRFLQGRSCMNCHSQVHGSNHPSGQSQMR